MNNITYIHIYLNNITYIQVLLRVTCSIHVRNADLQNAYYTFSKNTESLYVFDAKLLGKFGFFPHRVF
jgi:hypothetical protein